jgi:hypothetical protein
MQRKNLFINQNRILEEKNNFTKKQLEYKN